jgi:biopolymer transport protein ExbB
LVHHGSFGLDVRRGCLRIHRAVDGHPEGAPGGSGFYAPVARPHQQGNFASARNLCQTSNTPMARMLDKGISRIGKDLKDISTSIENIGKLEVYNLERNLPALATVSGAAPMIGFLGTVIGMVQVFVAMEAAGTVRVEDISSGTKQAMITTVFGLIVGILAYVAYNHLVSKVSKVINQMEATSIEFLDILEEPAR